MPYDPYDPRFLSQLAFSRGLLGLGAGIAGGRNWGEAIARGLEGFGAGQQQGTEEAARLAAYAEHQAAAERRRKLEETAAKLPAPPGSGVFGGPIRPRPSGAFDPAVWDSLPATEKFDIWKQILTREPHQFKPTISTIYHGDRAEQGYLDENNTWHKMGEGARFEGPAPQRMPLDATGWDASADGGRGGYVYLGGPYKGQVARPGPTTNDRAGLPTGYRYNDQGQAEKIPGLPAEAYGGTPNPSAHTEDYNRLVKDGFAASDAAMLSLGRDPHDVEAYRPVEPPRGEDGAIDPEQLDTVTRYKLPDGGIYLWDGTHFQPYDFTGEAEVGSYSDTPQGRAKYLGKGQWELQ